jgi:hypothetical protein
MHQKVPRTTAAKCHHLVSFSLSGISPKPPRGDKRRPLMQGSTALGICPRVIILPRFDVLRGGSLDSKVTTSFMPHGFENGL